MKNILKVVFTAALLIIFGFFINKDLLRFKEFLAANPVSRSLKIEQTKVKNKAMMITINHYRPDMALWKGFIIDGQPLDKSFLNDSVYYYGIISSYVPEIAEPQYMLGFCYSMSGDAPSALVAQKKAVVLEPHFFWGWYNLGVMYYQQGEFKESSQAFKKALEIPPQATVRILGASKIYGEVLRGLGTAESVAQPHLQQGYYDAARMLEASLLRYRGQPPGIDERQVQLKVF